EALDCTPSQLRYLLAERLDERASLSLALVGGEAIAPSLWQQLSESCGITFYNVYGPTECCVDTTVAEIEQGSDAATLGRPLPNMRIYILDDRRQPIPVGVAGEIYIGGVGMARGYMSRPDLTAERFLPDPYGGEPGARLYRTGDLGRHQEDGQVEYL